MFATGILKHVTFLALLAPVLLTSPAADAEKPEKPRMSEHASRIIQQKERDDQLVDLIVTYKAKPGANDAVGVRGQGGQVRRELGLIQGQAIRLPAKAAANLARQQNVRQVSIDEPLQAAYFTVGGSATNSSHTSTPAPVLHDYPALEYLPYKGKGIRIAVIDTGMKSHPDGKPLTKMSFVSGLKADDDNGHGNHVAGTIAGTGSHSNGPFRGVAPEADIVALRALDSQGAGQVSDVIEALT